MTVIRRLDDALHAFLTGHSRRDLDRVRRRRMMLLGGRMVVRRHEQAEESSLFASYYSCRAKAAASLVGNLSQGGHRRFGSALLQELEVDRGLVRSARVRGWAHVDALQSSDEYAIEFLKTAPVFSDERYGQLYEGLVQGGVLDCLQHHKRVCVRYGHEFLHLLKRFRREACGPP